MSTPRTLLTGDDKTERRMVLVQWLVMPLVLAGCLLPLPRPHEPPTHVFAAAAIMALHPLLYLLLSSTSVRRRPWPAYWRDALLTAADVTVATLVFYATVARPGYAQVLLYCAVALAATRYPSLRAFGITSLVALLLVFALLLPIKVSPPTLASEIVGLYALTYLVGLLSRAEKAVGAAATENARLARTVLQRNRELSTLHSVARALNAETDTTTLLQLGLDGMYRALELDGARAYTVEEPASRLTGPHRDAPRPEAPRLDTLCLDALRLGAHIGGDPEPDEVELRRRREAATAASESRTIIKGWRAATTSSATAAGHAAPDAPPPDTVHVSVPLTIGGAVGAVVQVDLAVGATASLASTLETLEVFCSELAIALENAELRGEAHRSAILHEKNRIAQELHDTVLQMLFSVGLRLQWSLDQLPAESALRAPLTEARHLSAQAGSELRGAIFTLKSEIAEIGLVPAVRQLVQSQATQAGWNANVVVSGSVPALPVLVQNAAHRVVREALMNAYKYARASEVVVSLRFTSALLTVVVQDNGRGIPEEALSTYRALPDHFGLRTVAEQVEALSGEFYVYNNDEQGAAIKAVIPLDAQASQAA